jgi:hypothetical protein
MFSLPLISLILTLAPFAGPALRGSIPDTAKFSVGIRGHAGQTVRLRAVGVPQGYIASFCTNRVCAAFRVSLALPASGRESIELQLIENVPGSPKPTTVTVAAEGARAASIAYRRAVR